MQQSVPVLVLYQRDECPLCDEALHVLAQARAPDFETVWIDDDPALEARYGIRVPVLRSGPDGRELDWPFDADAVSAFIAAGL
ncbi:glutaredoxin family protein [Luteimonas sp. A277]